MLFINTFLNMAVSFLYPFKYNLITDPKISSCIQCSPSLYRCLRFLQSVTIYLIKQTTSIFWERPSVYHKQSLYIEDVINSWKV